MSVIIVAMSDKWKSKNKEHLAAYRKQYYIDHKQEEIDGTLERRSRLTPQQRTALTKAYNMRHPEYLPNFRMLKTYNITLEDYKRMLIEQGGVCLICKCPPKGGSKSNARLHVDHDHACCTGNKSCGKCVRGLICSRCNLVLGQVNDNSILLQAMINYLGGDRQSLKSLLQGKYLMLPRGHFSVSMGV